MEGFSPASILEFLFGGIASAFASYVEETILAAANVLIELILGFTPTLG